MALQSLPLSEKPRDLSFGEELSSPEALVLEQAKAGEEQLASLLVALATERFELSRALAEASTDLRGDTSNAWKAVEIVLERMGAILEEHRVETGDPTGERWTDAMREEYELIGFTRREGLETARIAHVNTPSVKRFSRTLRKGAVTVDAPVEAPTRKDQEPTERED